jgi:arylsulfatase A-like enzyme
VQDTLVRLDRTIGRVLDHLDRAVGRDRYVVGFSADHGVAPLPEQTQAEGSASGRLPPARISEAVNHALEPILGPGPHVARSVYTDLYFAPGVYDRLRSDPKAMQAAIDAILSVDGVARVYRKEDLRSGSDWNDPMKRAAALSYFEGRSGDLVVVPRPFYSLSSEPTTHGTAYRYDSQVPVILYGAGIRSGRYLSAATPADLAPTLGFLVGVTMAAAEGRVLTEVLRPEPASRAPARTSPPAKRN